MDFVQENNKRVLVLIFSGILLGDLPETWYNLGVPTCKSVHHETEATPS